MNKKDEINRHYSNNTSSAVMGQQLTTKLKELELENNIEHQRSENVNEDDKNRIRMLDEQIKEQQVSHKHKIAFLNASNSVNYH